MVNRASFMWCAVGGLVAAEVAQEREDLLVDRLEHLAGGDVLEPRPAQVVVVATLVVGPTGNRVSIGLPGRLALFSASVCRSSSRRMNSR